MKSVIKFLKSDTVKKMLLHIAYINVSRQFDRMNDGFFY